MRNIIFILILFSVSVATNEKWDFKEDVQYLENHDPSMVWLSDGRKLEVVYGSISWEEVASWSKGKKLVLGYRIGVGITLHDPQTNKGIPVVTGMDKHPIDSLLDQCLKKDTSTKGMIDCYSSAHNNWDAELNAHYKKLMSTLNPKQKTLLKKSQRAWIKFKEAQFESIKAIYDRDGTMWGIVKSIQAMDITKEQALRLNRFTQ